MAKACVLLIEEALKPQGGSAQWGSEGYYFAESGEFAWKEVAEKISQITKEFGHIESADVDQLSVDEASKFHPWAPVLWGGNCRSRATRLRSLGWFSDSSDGSLDRGSAEYSEPEFHADRGDVSRATSCR